MDTRHPQVPVLGFECDEEIADVILLMNNLGIETTMSCQDSNGGRGVARRIWVEIFPEGLLPFLSMLDQAGEAGELDSLSHRIAPRYSPRDPLEREAFDENRAWHYTVHVGRYDDGELEPPTIGIWFPYTDLPEVVERLREAARELDGRTIQRPSGDSPGHNESNSQP